MSYIIAFSLIALLYFLPSIIASNRGHNNANSITIINLFLGWTFFVWVITLAWAFSNNVQKINCELPYSEEL